MAKKPKADEWDMVEFLSAHNGATRIMIQLLVLGLERGEVLEPGEYRRALLRYAEALEPGKSPKDKMRTDLIKGLLHDLGKLLESEPSH